MDTNYGIKLALLNNLVYNNTSRYYLGVFLFATLF